MGAPDLLIGVAFSKLRSRVSNAENALLEVMPGLVVVYALLLTAQPVTECRFGIFTALGGPFFCNDVLFARQGTGRIPDQYGLVSSLQPVAGRRCDRQAMRCTSSQVSSASPASGVH